MIDNAAPRETHLGSAIPHQRTEGTQQNEGQTGGSERVGAHRLDGPRATDAQITGSGSRVTGTGIARVTGSASRHVTGGAPAADLGPTVEPSRAVPAGRTSWFDDATMVLPAFVTGRVEAAAQAAADAVTEAISARTPADAVTAAGHAQAAARAQAAAETEAATGRPAPSTTSETEPDDKLPSSERNMLIFVAMLLALGTIAVIATMGVGKFG
ncbi:MAG TPA: hypothetical protein VE132_13625 [Micromonosporaceae bacterium]|nr:hypothetical protein [Micromonosporaceae bacterium]